MQSKRLIDIQERRRSLFANRSSCRPLEHDKLSQHITPTDGAVPMTKANRVALDKASSGRKNARRQALGVLFGLVGLRPPAPLTAHNGWQSQFLFHGKIARPTLFTRTCNVPHRFTWFRAHLDNGRRCMCLHDTYTNLPIEWKSKQSRVDEKREGITLAPGHMKGSYHLVEGAWARVL